MLNAFLTSWPIKLAWGYCNALLNEIKAYAKCCNCFSHFKNTPLLFCNTLFCTQKFIYLSDQIIAGKVFWIGLFGHGCRQYIFAVLSEGIMQRDTIDNRSISQCKYLWYLHGGVRNYQRPQAILRLLMTLLSSKLKRGLPEPKGRISEFSSNPFPFLCSAARQNLSCWFLNHSQITIPRDKTCFDWIEMLL